MRYKLSKSDYYKAYLLHIKPRLVYTILAMLLFCVFILGLYYAIIYHNTAIMLNTIVGIFIILIFVLLFPMYTINKSFKQTKGIESEIELSISDDAISLLAEKGHVVIPYEDVFKIKSNRHYLLVYCNQYFYYIIPKRDSDLILAAGTIEGKFKL